MNVIDLDQGAAQPGEPRDDRRPQWRRVAIAAALLLTGALLGGLITHRWMIVRQEKQRDSTVSVLVLATINPADAGTARRVAGAPRASVATDVQVTIVNTGRVAITVLSLSAAPPGATLSTIERQRRIDPGAAVTADAVLTVDCAAGFPVGDLVATLSVVTWDDTARPAPVTFSAGPWNDQLEASCPER